MTVTPLEGELFRFHVQSEVGDGVYFVDLEENCFRGRCDCPHYRCRISPRLTPSTPAKATRCKHIQAARDYWFDDVAPRVSTALATLHEQRLQTHPPTGPSEGS